MKFTQFVKNLHRDDSGQDALEYALVLAAIVAVVVTGSQSLATTISGGIATLNGKIQTAISTL